MEIGCELQFPRSKSHAFVRFCGVTTALGYFCHSFQSCHFSGEDSFINTETINSYLRLVYHINSWLSWSMNLFVFSEKTLSDMNSMHASSCPTQPKIKLQQDPLTFEDRFHPSIVGRVPVGAVKLLICAYNVILYTIPLSPLPPSLTSLSWCHAPDRLHHSYCVSPGRYVYFRHPPISWLLINQHFPWFHMSHKFNLSAPWSCTSGFDDCHLKSQWSIFVHLDSALMGLAVLQGCSFCSCCWKHAIFDWAHFILGTF